MDTSGSILAELQSLEGTSADEWPTSPVLQSCSLQEIRPGHIAAFLVGMAGQSHWSASIEAVPGEGTIVLDYACRVHEQPAWLGTTYVMAFLPQAGVTLFQKSSEGITVEIYRPSDSVYGFQVDGQLLTMPCTQTPARFPATLRWQYRIRLFESAVG